MSDSDSSLDARVKDQYNELKRERTSGKVSGPTDRARPATDLSTRETQEPAAAGSSSGAGPETCEEEEQPPDLLTLLPL